MENEPKICWSCTHCIPIGDGAHLCDAFDEPILVIDDYEPTDDYLRCNTSEYESWDDEE